MAQSAQKMGYKVIVLDPNEDCPCRYVAHQFIHANYDDEQALNQLGENLMLLLMSLKIFRLNN